MPGLRRKLGIASSIFVVSFDPAIVACFWKELREDWRAVRALLPDRRVDALCLFGWEVESEHHYRSFLATVAELRERLPTVSFHFLANTEASHRKMRDDGLSSVFCSHNAFIDERRFRLVDPARRAYDALYLARLAPFKRHGLARDVASLYMIGDYAAADEAYARDVVEEVAPARWVRRVGYSKLVDHFTRASTGLCLSRAEGAMYASIEYLLAGLPVVSTRSRGGRDVFFDPAFVALADETPEAVREAVEALKSRDLDPRDIRETTLATVRSHRTRFDELVNGLLERGGARPNFRWEERRFHKLGLRCNVPLRDFHRSNPFLLRARRWWARAAG